MSRDSCVANKFNKELVRKAAERTLAAILNDRDIAKLSKTKGMRRYFWFGPVLPIEEAWNRLTDMERLIIKCMHGRQEQIVERILAMVKFTKDDEVWLSLDELSAISHYAEV